MKLYYFKILLFSLLLNILSRNKNKTYVRSHRPTTASRVLSECDIETSIYDNDADMKSVKENFDRQTSQRFEEYEERMQEKRKKRKEQCDKDIEQIILRDKTKKSLEEKIEKCCLKCGCGLGGVAASVGIFGGIAISELKKAAMIAAIASAQKTGVLAGEAARIPAGIKAVIEGLMSEFSVSTLGGQKMESFFTTTFYTDFSKIANAVYEEYSATCISRVGGSVLSPVPRGRDPICMLVSEKLPHASQGSTRTAIETTVKTVVSDAEISAGMAVEKATKDSITLAMETNISEVNATYASCQTAIIASAVAILVIVLVMVIIYLILRYRRKKKMNKKLQYTKLLNQ
ncbi:hypothetical protein PFNF135_00006 [Plasmodium falciparum NF135/5.C10]|uniref:Surface antigen n=1 Tax=Plasmodium falciparum NF135/5.C10 TaxID=1036726 RepID=W4IR21_PLAFA|nr:hypothetical protein PFNF135_00006 [Plasmodium falciparum NF135/5.C10]